VSDSEPQNGARSDQAGDAHALSFREAQERVHAWISQFEEGYWPPLTNLARLIEEVGELAREMNHRFGHKTKKADEPEQDLAIELADILFVLLVIANEQGIDMDDALERVLEKYRVRDSDRWTPVSGRQEGTI
jgi:NTP pyrophosphatase (non-canonical NTP hydrolase)